MSNPDKPLRVVRARLGDIGYIERSYHPDGSYTTARLYGRYLDAVPVVEAGGEPCGDLQPGDETLPLAERPEAPYPRELPEAGADVTISPCTHPEEALYDDGESVYCTLCKTDVTVRPVHLGDIDMYRVHDSISSAWPVTVSRQGQLIWNDDVLDGGQACSIMLVAEACIVGHLLGRDVPIPAAPPPEAFDHVVLYAERDGDVFASIVLTTQGDHSIAGDITTFEVADVLAEALCRIVEALVESIGYQ